MKVAIVFDGHALARAAAPDVAGVFSAVLAVERALAAFGHRTVRVPVANDDAWRHHLLAWAPEVVFNLCEGVAGDSGEEATVAEAIERMHLPVTGAPAEALARARRKEHVNALLAGTVPVAAWMLAEPAAIAAWCDYPAIVKPAHEDAGIGITRQAVVGSTAELSAALHAARAHAPLLVQRFLAGRELVVGFVGECTLPVAEIEYDAMPAGLPRVVGYAAKWDPGSPEDIGTAARCPARVDAAVAAEAIGTARAAWHALTDRGYARVDLRADQEGVLHVLDVNLNPDLSPDAGLARMAAAAGWSYSGLVERILLEAVRT